MSMRCAYWVGILCLVGCGAGEIKREDLGQEAIKALCASMVRCGTAKAEDSCVQELNRGAGFGNTPYEEGVAAGRVKYDGARARKCLDALRNAACPESGLQALATNEDCERMYQGTLGVGQACSWGECVPTAYCTSEIDFKCPATCLERVQEGNAATSSVQCAEGLILRDGLCQKPVAENGACTGSVCEPGLFCDPSAKACQRPHAKGETCGFQITCAADLVCVDGKCASPGDVNDACSGTNQVGCKLELFCDSGSSTCKVELNEGASCNKSDQCQPQLVCAGITNGTGTCRAPAEENQSCQAAGECHVALYCDLNAKVCKPRIAEGEACTQSNSCAEGSCEGGKCPPPLTVCR